jgi:hypothetical protein
MEKIPLFIPPKLLNSFIAKNGSSNSTKHSQLCQTNWTLCWFSSAKWAGYNIVHAAGMPILHDRFFSLVPSILLSSWWTRTSSLTWKKIGFWRWQWCWIDQFSFIFIVAYAVDSCRLVTPSIYVFLCICQLFLLHGTTFCCRRDCPDYALHKAKNAKHWTVWAAFTIISCVGTKQGIQILFTYIWNLLCAGFGSGQIFWLFSKCGVLIPCRHPSLFEKICSISRQISFWWCKFLLVLVLEFEWVFLSVLAKYLCFLVKIVDKYSAVGFNLILPSY